MSDAIQIPREVLESRYNFVVRGDLEIDIVTVADHVATLIGTYAIPAIRIKGAERSYIGCVPWHSEFHEDFTEVFDASEAIQRTGAPGAPKCADLAS